jgi:gliding motility-associated-like protein
MHIYQQYGSYCNSGFCQATNGCWSDTIDQPVTIVSPLINAGPDTLIIRNQPYQLQATGNGNFNWTPATGLSDATISNPVTSLSAAQTYVLTVTTIQGCQSSDTVHLKVMDGPMVYMPGAFTPNADGRNDLLRPVYVGIAQLQKFAIYNRWGQLVFSTTDMMKGWDGKVKDHLLTTDTFVWQIMVVTDQKQYKTFKGTVTLIQ